VLADFESFKNELNLSKVEICRELYGQNRALIRIKNEDVAVKNLVRIINSTLRLASSKGFHAMSLRDLCADSGFSIGGLYAYIRSKEDLILLIQGHGFLLTRRTLLACTEATAPPREKLLTALKAHIYLSEIMQPWFYFSFMETKSLPDKAKKEAIAVEKEIEDIFYDIIREGIAQKAFRDVNARLLASLCKAMMQDWYLKRRKYSIQGTTVTQYAEFVGEVLKSHLLPR
jgi:AcrR family transcriptional regulator